MFGRKKTSVEQAIPVPPGAGYDQLDVILLALSTKFGLKLSEVGQGYILSPRLWEDVVCNQMLLEQGLQANQIGNMVMLFKDAESVRRLNQSPECAPVKEVLESSGFGFVPYDEKASNGFSDELTTMQLQTIRGFSVDYKDDANARKYAVWDLHRFCTEVFKGRAAN